MTPSTQSDIRTKMTVVQQNIVGGRGKGSREFSAFTNQPLTHFHFRMI